MASECFSNYVVIVDPRGVFRGQNCTTFADISDGADETILVVDVSQQSVHWMSPHDISATEFMTLFHEDTELNHPRDVNVLLADGSVRSLSKSIGSDDLAALLTSQSDDEVDLSRE